MATQHTCACECCVRVGAPLYIDYRSALCPWCLLQPPTWFLLRRSRAPAMS